MSPVPVLLLGIAFLLFLLAIAPALFLVAVVGVVMLVAERIHDSRTFTRLYYRIRYYVELIENWVFDGAMFVALRGEGFIANVRYAIRMYRSYAELLGIRANLQEIHEIVHRVERGEWSPEIGDPFDHVKYEAKKGMVATGSLLYGPD